MGEGGGREGDKEEVRETEKEGRKGLRVGGKHLDITETLNKHTNTLLTA